MNPNVAKGLLTLITVAAGVAGYDVVFSDRMVEVVTLVVGAFSAGAAWVTIKPKAGK